MKDNNAPGQDSEPNDLQNTPPAPGLVGTPPSPAMELGSTNSDKNSGSKSSSSGFVNIPSPITNPPKKHRSSEGEKNRGANNKTEIPKMNLVESPESPTKVLEPKDEELALVKKPTNESDPFELGGDSILMMQFEPMAEKIKTDKGKRKIQTQSGWENNRDGQLEKDVFGKNSLPKTSKMESIDASIINVTNITNLRKDSTFSEDLAEFNTQFEGAKTLEFNLCDDTPMKETKPRPPRPQETPERYSDNEIEQPLLGNTDNSDNEDLPNHVKGTTAKSGSKSAKPTLVSKSNLDSSIDVSPSLERTVDNTVNVTTNMGEISNKKRVVKRSMNNRNETTGLMVKKNIMNNRKYNIWTFLPMLIFNQFKFFFNFYFLVITCSQFFDIFNLGYLFVYAAP